VDEDKDVEVHHYSSTATPSTIENRTQTDVFMSLIRINEAGMYRSLQLPGCADDPVPGSRKSKTPLYIQFIPPHKACTSVLSRICPDIDEDDDDEKPELSEGCANGPLYTYSKYTLFS
jgi:hypothetical protein